MFCAECAEPKYRLVPVHPLPRSGAHDLDARALRARLEDRERVIAAFRERCQKLEEALRFYADPVTYVLDDANGYWPDAQFPIFEDEGKRALAALDAKEGG